MSKSFNSFEAELGPADAWELIGPRLSPARRARMLKAVSQKTAYIRLAMQDVMDPHNVGACLRSAEAFGLQHCDVIDVLQAAVPRKSTVSRGAQNWLDLHHFDSIETYVTGLKQRGYRLAAAYPQKKDWDIDALPITQPLALVFGNERAGLHHDWEKHVDYRFTIPMYGMVESFNISVSVALSLFSVQQRARVAVPPEQFLISEEEQAALLRRWVKRHSRAVASELERLRQPLIKSPAS